MIIIILSIVMALSSILATPSFMYRHQIIEEPPMITNDDLLYRLPTTSAPLNYTINLILDPDSEVSFSGMVNTTIEVLNATERIILHAHTDMIIENVTIIDSEAVVRECEFKMSGNSNHFLYLDLKTQLSANTLYNIVIYYIGKYGDLKGIYRSSYKDDENNERYLVTTQFQAVNAREAFPCYDEPHLKAVFELTIQHPNKYHAVSNAGVENIYKNGSNAITKFFKTPKMSTYLLAFVVSDFNMKSNAGNQIMAKDFAIFARPNANDSLDYALEFGQKSLADLEAWIGFPFRMMKMDKFAIPDFAAGAMENWGLVTYREEYLLHKPGVTSVLEEQFISAVISHENAHMWFGNEVTPAWWDYIWLSEGFATYLEYFITDRVLDNKFRMMDQFVVDYMQNIMHSDAKASTNPMTNHVLSPYEIENNFNGIVYDKAGGVIRMMRHVLGEKSFQQGLKKYISDHSSKGITDPNKLFDELNNVAYDLPNDTSINEIFGSWSNQKGFPIVTAQKGEENTTIDLFQEHYSVDSLPSKNKWWIPITWTDECDRNFNNTKPKQWLIPGVNSTIILKNQEAWFILNIQHTGFYRIMYDNQNWNRLIDALKSKEHDGIHYLNRAQLIDDSYSFAMSNRLSYNITMNILSYLKNEEDFIPWISAERVLNYLNIIMPASSHYNRYKEFTMNILENISYKLGFYAKSSDSEIDKMHRVIAVNIECKSASLNIRNMANDMISRSMTISDYSIDPDLKATIYCCGLRQSSEEQWNYVLTIYNKTQKPDERNILIESLGCTENKDIANRYLQMSIKNNSHVIKSEERYKIIVSLINAGTLGLDYALDFILKYYSEMQIIMNNDVVHVINALKSKIVTDNQINKFLTFKDLYKHTFTYSEKYNLDIAHQVVLERSVRMRNVLKEIDPWLLENVKLNNV